MIPATIYQLLQAAQPRERDKGQNRSPLDMLLQQTTSADIAWQIREIADAIRAALARFEEIRLSLANHYGQPTEADPGRYTFENDDKQNAFLQRYKELLDYRVQLPIEPLQRQQIAAAKLSASDLDALSFLFNLPPTPNQDPLADFKLPELQPED